MSALACKNCLIIGLPCHEAQMNLDCSSDRLRNLYFNGSKKISMRMLSEVFHLRPEDDDKFKLGLVMLVECVLKPTERYIDYRTFSMVEHIDEFLAYPWDR